MYKVQEIGIDLQKPDEYPVSNFERKIILRLGAVAQTCNPSTLGGRGRRIMRSRARDHPGQRGETPSLLKMQKLAGCGGPCL